MDKDNRKFAVKKPYIKVQRDYASSDSSAGKPDYLSYSYSCIQAFKKNQHIIGNIASLGSERQCQGLDFQPVLFSLSGDRAQPIYQPFYCSTESDTPQIRNYDTYIRYNDTCGSNIHNSTESKSESELGFFEKNLFIEWLKYRLKYVNSLWPFSIPKNTFLSKICNKSRKMKMEMLMNNIDEETKSELKKRANDLNLNFEERYSLCNESIIEIDITPILADTECLHAFLTFLKHIESSTTGEERGHPKRTSGITNKFTFQDNLFTKPTTENHSLFRPKRRQEKNYNNCSADSFNQYKEQQWSEKAGYGLYSKTERSQHRQAKAHTKAFFERTPSSHSNNELRINSGEYSVQKNSNLTAKQNIQDNFSNIGLQVSKEGDYLNWPSKKGMESEQNVSYTQPRLCIHQNGNSFTHTTHRCDMRDKKQFSCKCLMHKDREDYNRYKNQCLFGNGDENNNSFIKYLALEKQNSELHPSKVLHPNMIFGNEQVETEADDENKAGKVENETEEVKKEAKNIFKTRIYNKGKYNKVDKQLGLFQDKQKTSKPQKKSILEQKGNSHPLLNHTDANLKHNKIPKALKIDDGKKSTGNRKCIKKENEVIKYPKDSYNFNPIILTNNDEQSDCSLTNVNFDQFKVARVEDVEKLVSAVNYCDDTNSFNNNCGDISNSNNTFQKNIGKETYKKISVDTCFESLNYSLNSLGSITKSKSSIQLSNTCSTSPPNKINKVTVKKSLSESNLYIDYSADLNENGEKNNTIKEKKDKKLKKRKNISSKRFQKSYNSKYVKESRFVEILYDCEKSTTDGKATKSSMNHKNKVQVDNITQNQYEILIKNKNELQEKITALNASLVRSKNDQNAFQVDNQQMCRKVDNHCNNNQNLDSKPNKMNMVIKFSGSEKSQIIDSTSRKSNKKHFKLNLLKPKNMYRSISSVFNRNNKNNNFSNNEIIQKSFPRQRVKSSESNEENSSYQQCRINSSTKCKSNESMIENFNTSNESMDENFSECKSNESMVENLKKSPMPNNLAAFQIDSPIILNNLENLYTELQNQRLEINNMKRLLQDRFR